MIPQTELLNLKKQVFHNFRQSPQHSIFMCPSVHLAARDLLRILWLFEDSWSNSSNSLSLLSTLWSSMSVVWIFITFLWMAMLRYVRLDIPLYCWRHNRNEILASLKYDVLIGSLADGCAWYIGSGGTLIAVLSNHLNPACDLWPNVFRCANIT